MTTLPTEQMPSQEYDTAQDEPVIEEPTEEEKARELAQEQRITRIRQIEAAIRRLPQEKLDGVFDYVAFLVNQQPDKGLSLFYSSAIAEWLSPEEDEAWKDL